MEQKIVIVGTHHRGADALAAIGKLAKGDPITLHREPENAYDPGAVACYAGALHLGYLPKAQYTTIRDALDKGLVVTAELGAEALMDGASIAPGGLPRLIVRWSDIDHPAPDIGPNQNDGPADFSEDRRYGNTHHRFEPRRG